MNHAVKWQLIARNVADAVQAPRAKRPGISVPGLQEIQRLLEAARDHQDYALICTAIFTGMRRAELLGLQWENVYTNTGTISIRQTLQRLPGQGFIFTDPKSQKSRRQVLIPSALVEILKEHRRRQLENRMRLGERYQDHNPVFPRADGRPEDPSNMSHRFKILGDRLGLTASLSRPATPARHHPPGPGHLPQGCPGAAWPPDGYPHLRYLFPYNSHDTKGSSGETAKFIGHQTAPKKLSGHHFLSARYIMKALIYLVPETGLEPVRVHNTPGILSPVRLPVPPLRHEILIFINLRALFQSAYYRFENSFDL
ncbi:Phage integrase family protein [Desulfofundulus australicus DSM 11792]|uniref:Phage integrase family protein n=1 Tax=Desulfofundulus australicus DSM 11792 TaxID=1121425 RepID=A0A1M5CZX5_9FIRM|nr:Phage integrase family protein [Desulfofundulus australicus DSM 11792]